MPDGLEHPPHLSFPPLVDDEFDCAGVVSLGIVDKASSRGCGRGLFNLDPAFKSFQLYRCDAAISDSDVGLIHLMRGVCEELGKIPVIGEDQQAGSIHIQPPDRVNILVYPPKQFKDSMAGVRVRARAGVAHGLIEQQVNFFLGWFNGNAVDGNPVLFRIYFRAEFRDSLAVDCDPT